MGITPSDASSVVSDDAWSAVFDLQWNASFAAASGVGHLATTSPIRRAVSSGTTAALTSTLLTRTGHATPLGLEVLEWFNVQQPEHKLKRKGARFADVELPLLLALCSHGNLSTCYCLGLLMVFDVP